MEFRMALWERKQDELLEYAHNHVRSSTKKSSSSASSSSSSGAATAAAQQGVPSQQTVSDTVSEENGNVEEAAVTAAVYQRKPFKPTHFDLEFLVFVHMGPMKCVPDNWRNDKWVNLRLSNGPAGKTAPRDDNGEERCGGCGSSGRINNHGHSEENQNVLDSDEDSGSEGGDVGISSSKQKRSVSYANRQDMRRNTVQGNFNTFVKKHERNNHNDHV